MSIYGTRVFEISREHDPALYYQIFNEIRRFKKGENAIYRIYNKKPQAKKCYTVPKSSLKFDKEQNTIIFPQNKLKIQIPFSFNWDDLKLIRIKQKLTQQKCKISLVFKHPINRTRAIRRAYRGFVELDRNYRWKTYPQGSDAKFPSIKKILAPVTKKNSQGKLQKVITKNPKRAREKITNYDIEIKKLESAIAKRQKQGLKPENYWHLLTRLKTLRERRKQIINQEITKIAKRVGRIAYRENLFLVIDKTLDSHKTKYFYFTLLEALKREFTKRNLLVIHRRNREDIEPFSKTFLCDLLKEVEYNIVGRKLSIEPIDKSIYEFWETGEKEPADVFGFGSPEEKRIYTLVTYMEHLNLVEGDVRKRDIRKELPYMTTYWDGTIHPWAAGKGDGSGYPTIGLRFWRGPIEVAPISNKKL